MLSELKKLSLWEMWRDGFERILRIRVWVMMGLLLMIWVRVCGFLERVLVMEATVSNSATCFNIDGAFMFHWNSSNGQTVARPAVAARTVTGAGSGCGCNRRWQLCGRKKKKKEQQRNGTWFYFHMILLT